MSSFAEPRLYQRIRAKIAGIILDGRVRDGDCLPSVRALAADCDANPLTVAKAYSALQATGIIEARHGIGFFLRSGGTARLREAERAKFLSEDWPRIASEIKRLGICRSDLSFALNVSLRTH